MLDGMRKATRGLIGRTIMALVVAFISLSFVVWGVGDIFRGFGGNTVAIVGKTEIPADALRNSYQTQLQQLQRQSRRAVTNDQARAMGLDSRVLAKLIADAALDDRAKGLGLAMSDAEIARTILADPNFAGPGGKFDSSRFNEILRDNGFTERSFAQEQRKVYLRQEFVDALAGNVGVPKAALEAIHKYRAETRSVDYIELPATAAGEIGKPDDAALQAYFEARRATFRAPEFRSFVTLSVTPSGLANPSDVTNEDAMALYNRVRTQRFLTPEKREIQQVLFADEKAASEASDKVKGGATLDAIAQEYKTSIITLGDMTRAEVFDKAIGDAAYALAEAAVSPPVKGQFGNVLVRVARITPEIVKPFDEVAADLKKEISLERAKKAVSDLRDKVEDERTSGKALADAAKTAGLTTMIVDGSDQGGRNRNGGEYDNLPERDALLKAIFASDIGVDNETINTRDNGYLWYEVTNVEKARERTLAEVRERVESAWREDEISRRLQDKAAGLVKKIEAGESLDDIAKAEGELEKKNVADARRSETSALPAGVVARVFSVAVGKAGSAEGANGGRVIFKVLDAATPDFDPESETNKGVDNQLKSSLGEDILVQYLARLQTDLGVSINQSVARVATGGTADAN